MKNLVVYRCQQCGGPKKALDLPRVRESVVFCSGQIEAAHVIRPFEKEILGVCVVRCAPGRCRTLEGSSRAGRRVEFAKKRLAEAGVDPARVALIDHTDTPGTREAVAEFLKALTKEAHA
jgi:coenzyme F420-reducing hydrogenase delta subunit